MLIVLTSTNWEHLLQDNYVSTLMQRLSCRLSYSMQIDTLHQCSSNCVPRNPGDSIKNFDDKSFSRLLNWNNILYQKHFTTDLIRLGMNCWILDILLNM
jgi:hypothetical protein